jgi:hypothetical protein
VRVGRDGACAVTVRMKDGWKSRRLAAALIILRKGLEAAPIVGIVLGGLGRMGYPYGGRARAATSGRSWS